MYFNNSTHEELDTIIKVPFNNRESVNRLTLFNLPMKIFFYLRESQKDI